MWRAVRPLNRNPLNLVHVVGLMCTVPNFLPTDDPYSVFRNDWNTFYAVANVGIIGVVDPRGMSAHCHVTFWDRRLRGRELLCREIAQLHMEASRLQALWTVVPVGRDVVKAFVQRVGFEFMGSERGHDTFIMKRSSPNGR